MALARYKKLAEDHPIEIFEPEYNISKLNNIYQSAKLFVYPSLADQGETFGLAPLEAMSNGCVPIVSSLGCFEDFIQPRSNGFQFNHKQEDASESLSKTLQLLIDESDSELLKIHEKALETANTFSTANVAQRFLKDFQNCI